MLCGVGNDKWGPTAEWFWIMTRKHNCKRPESLIYVWPMMLLISLDVAHWPTAGTSLNCSVFTAKGSRTLFNKWGLSYSTMYTNAFCNESTLMNHFLSICLFYDLAYVWRTSECLCFQEQRFGECRPVLLIYGYMFSIHICSNICVKIRKT